MNEKIVLPLFRMKLTVVNTRLFIYACEKAFYINYCMCAHIAKSVSTSSSHIGYNTRWLVSPRPLNVIMIQRTPSRLDPIRLGEYDQIVWFYVQ